jgi:hypothetical protein
MSDLFYCMHQCIFTQAGEPVSECYLKLVFVNDGRIVKAPEDVKLHFCDGDEGMRYGDCATVHGDVAAGA